MGFIHKGRLLKFSKNQSSSTLSTFVHLGPYPLPPPVDVHKCDYIPLADLTKILAINSDLWTSSNYQMSREWLLLALAGHSAGCSCQQVLSVCLSVCLCVCLLPIRWTPQSTSCMLRFIQLVTLSLFLSLSTVHCYTLLTSSLTTNLVRFCLHWGVCPPPFRVDGFYG